LVEVSVLPSPETALRHHHDFQIALDLRVLKGAGQFRYCSTVVARLVGDHGLSRRRRQIQRGRGSGFGSTSGISRVRAASARAFSPLGFAVVKPAPPAHARCAAPLAFVDRRRRRC